MQERLQADATAVRATNLTAKNALSGTPPVGSYPTNPVNNQLTGVSYDGNGNQLSANGATLTYDVLNRMTVSTTSSLQGNYEYDPKNRRVYQLKQSWNGSSWTNTAQLYYFYGTDGAKAGTFTATVAGSSPSASMSWSLQSTQAYFAGHLIKNPTGVVQEDVRGSVGSYYPYGENRGTPAPDQVQFATYTGDSMTGLDYAVNRYYAPGAGRFLSPDPYAPGPSGRKRLGSSNPMNPQSFNRYSYVLGDPVNGTDPVGLCFISFTGTTGGPSSGCFDDPGGASTSGPSGIINSATITNGSQLDSAYNEYDSAMGQAFNASVAAWSAAYAAKQAQQTSNSAYTIFQALAPLLGLDPDNVYTVQYQIRGNTVNVQIQNSDGTYTYTFDDLNGFDGVLDPITWFHSGNPSYYENDPGISVLHVVDVIDPGTSGLWPGVEGHIDRINPITSVGGFVGHFIGEVIPYLLNPNGGSGTLACSASSGGCTP